MNISCKRTFVKPIWVNNKHIKTLLLKETYIMDINDFGYDNFDGVFYVENTFICGSSATISTEASAQLSLLNSIGNTVIITDPYLFPTSFESTYVSDLIRLLSDLKASKIIYCASKIQNNSLYKQVENALNTVGTVLEFSDKLKDFHDRFWYCPETNKSVVFGTSLNGIGRKICRIDMLTAEETVELKKYFVNEGIISGDDNGT